MSYRDEIIRRLNFLHAEFAALARLVELDGGGVALAAPVVAAPAPVVESVPVEPVAAAPEAEPAGDDEPAAKVRWSYLPGAVYRIRGENPFRSDGNNFAFFNHLRGTYGSGPFTREDLGTFYEGLKKSGVITTEQTEESFVKVFLRQAGVEKGRLAMVAKGGGAGAEPAAASPVAAEESLPPEAGEPTGGSGGYKLKGSPRFRGDSINRRIFEALGRKRFTRKSLNELVREMVADGRVPSERPIPMITSEFFRFVDHRGHVVAA